MATKYMHMESALLLDHDHTGHNGIRCTYAALKRLYYWRGMKKDIKMHFKHCQTCAKYHMDKSKYNKDNF